MQAYETSLHKAAAVSSAAMTRCIARLYPQLVESAHPKVAYAAN